MYIYMLVFQIQKALFKIVAEHTISSFVYSIISHLHQVVFTLICGI